MKRMAVVASTIFFTLNPALALDCKMSLDFKQPDENGTTSVAVYADNAKSGLLFADSMKVNTDGTLRSYSVDDFWGERVALNNICNASSDACAGLSSEGLRNRRLLVQKAKAEQWPASSMADTKIEPDIIPFKDGRPCPEKDGFLVSATALHKPNVRDVCDIDNYVDSLKVSAIVLPRGVKPPGQARKKSEFQNRGVEVGDLTVTATADFSVVSYAVVGDTGPVKELGEVSVALAKNLLKRDKLPENYQEVRGRGEFRGKGWSPGKTFVLVFPRTRDNDIPFLTQDRIDKAASAAFTEWGGVDRLRACAGIYKK